MYPTRVSQAPRGLSKRITSIAESATLKVDAKAKALKAEGRPIISFAAGEPDFPTPAHVVDAALAAVKDPANHRYTPAAGLPTLREAIAEKTLRDSGWKVEPSQVVVTNGGKQAVYQACATLLDPGDEMLLPAPTGPPIQKPSLLLVEPPSLSSQVLNRTTKSRWNSSRPPELRRPKL